MTGKKIVGTVSVYRGRSLNRVKRGSPTAGGAAREMAGGRDERA
jgi:hypothetical protein